MKEDHQGNAAAHLVTAVIFDLDDTLFDQRDYLAGAWKAVAAAAVEQGLPEREFLVELQEVAREGSARGRIIDRALLRCGAGDVDVEPLVAAFLGFRPERLPLYPGVASTLTRLRASGVRTAVVTDGAVESQLAKIDALGLRELVDVIVLSDELGRQFRKPDPAPMVDALRKLGVERAAAVVIGDRPDKDIAGAIAAGIRPIRVRTGEYRDQPDIAGTWQTAANAVDAIAGLARDGLVPTPATPIG